MTIMTNEERAREALNAIETAREKMDGPVCVGFQWVVYNLDLPPLGAGNPSDNTISHWTFATREDALDFMRVRAMTAAINAATAELEEERVRLREALALIRDEDWQWVRPEDPSEAPRRVYGRWSEIARKAIPESALAKKDPSNG